MSIRQTANITTRTACTGSGPGHLHAAARNDHLAPQAYYDHMQREAGTGYGRSSGYANRDGYSSSKRYVSRDTSALFRFS